MCIHIGRLISLAGMFALAVAATNSTPAYADDDQLEEVVVTARQRSEKLSTAPISVTAFTTTTVERANIKSVPDFVALTTNMTYTSTTDAGDTAVQIRGIIQPRDSEPPYALVVDGVILPNPNSLNRQLNDIDQIEVLKGPQGALYGRNAIAGAIIINTKAPTNEFVGKVNAGYATGNETSASGSFSGPLIPDKLLFGVGASILDREGYYHNITLQNMVDPYDEKTVRARLIWNASDNLTLDGKFEYGKINGFAINFNAQADIFTPFLSPNPTGVYKLAGGVNANNASQPYFSSVHNFDIQNRAEGALKGEYRTPFGAIKLTGAFSRITEPAGGDGAVNLTIFNNPPGATVINVLPNNNQAGYTSGNYDSPQLQTRNEKDETVELRFTSNADQPFRYVFGGYYAYIDREVILANTKDVAGIVLPNPVDDANSLSPTSNLTWTDTVNHVKSVFANGSYDVLRNLEATIALRYDSETKTNVLLTPHIPTPADPSTYLTPFLDGDPARTRSKTFAKLQPKYTLSYKATPDNVIYASYGLAFRSGGFNPLGSRATILSVDQQPQTTVQDEFPSEISKSYEAGFKTSWFDRRVVVNGAIFSTSVTDAQNFQFYPISFSRVVTTVDKIDIRGAELEAQAHVADGLNVDAAVGYVHTEVKEDLNNPAAVGNRQPYTPQYSVNVGAQYVRPITEVYSFTARCDFQRLGSEYFNIENTPGTRRDPLNLVNVSLGIEGDKWDATFYGKNVFNVHYNTDVVVLPASFGNYAFVTHAVPAIFGINVRYKF